MEHLKNSFSALWYQYFTLLRTYVFSALRLLVSVHRDRFISRIWMLYCYLCTMSVTLSVYKDCTILVRENWTTRGDCPDCSLRRLYYPRLGERREVVVVNVPGGDIHAVQGRWGQEQKTHWTAQESQVWRRPLDNRLGIMVMLLMYGYKWGWGIEGR